MKRHILSTAIAFLTLVLSAGTARAFPPKGVCGFEHPRKANTLKAQLVQAFVSCGNVGGNSPNATTEGGVPTCKPPLTFNDQVGSPLNGWHFDPLRGRSKVHFRTASNIVSPTQAGPLNPSGCTVDIHIEFRLVGVIDTVGPANGTGALATLARATLQDRGPDHICGNQDDMDMTVVDFPANFPFTLVNGGVHLDTSADALLNSIGQYGLPHCTSLEVVSLTVLDPNGNTFANQGVYMP